MSEAPGYTFNFVEDDPDYYLVGDQITHSKMFRAYTVAAAHDTGSAEKTGYPSYVLNLAELHTLPEADKLVARGWQRAVFIGKLMVSSRASEEAEIEENRTSNMKSASPDDLYELIHQKVGFSTGLFLVQPLLEQYEGDFRLSHLPPSDTPQLIASFRNDSSRALRVIPADHEEHYYDAQYGTLVKDLQAVGEESWTAIEKLHRSFYDNLSNEIGIRQPG